MWPLYMGAVVLGHVRPASEASEASEAVNSQLSSYPLSSEFDDYHQSRMITDDLVASSGWPRPALAA